MRWLSALALVVTTALPRIAFAHGVVGDYIFLEPLVAEDPTPANEFNVVQPSWSKTSDGHNFSLGYGIEKVLYLDDEFMPRLSAGVTDAWSYQWPRHAPDLHGFDDLEMFVKWAFAVSQEHEFLLSAAALLQVPAGTPGVQEQSHTSLGPELLWEKGMGDLPNWKLIRYLRPFGFQGDFGYLPALGGHTSHQMFADQVVEYSLPYLSNSVQDIGLGFPLRNLFLFTEFNYSQLIAGPAQQTFPSIVATPGIAYVGYYFELSFGTQLALNRAAVPDTHAVVIGLLDIFYDSILTKYGNWSINRGLPR
ncbi:MAG TPA: hypothetical protein VKT27_11985 [Candidatus Binataceae bacterium]|nr:hypothetical protein [Candidatus Binataceae bacterium]